MWTNTFSRSSNTGMGLRCLPPPRWDSRRLWRSDNFDSPRGDLSGVSHHDKSNCPAVPRSSRGSSEPRGGEERLCVLRLGPEAGSPRKISGTEMFSQFSLTKNFSKISGVEKIIKKPGRKKISSGHKGDPHLPVYLHPN
jgi:hypothetical protein